MERASWSKREWQGAGPRVWAISASWNEPSRDGLAPPGAPRHAVSVLGPRGSEKPCPAAPDPDFRPQTPLARLEAILFLAREPLSTRKLGQLAGLADGTQARTLVRKLNRLYDAEGFAFRIEEVAGGLQLMSRPEFAPWLRRLQAVPVEVRLSPPALETLSVVAYRQPVLRVEIEAVRGVQCGEILRQLMERELVRIVGRSEELGRPFLYGTTKRFLQIFGLRHLDELPRPELLRAAADQPEPPKKLSSDSNDSDKEIIPLRDFVPQP